MFNILGELVIKYLKSFEQTKQKKAVKAKFLFQVLLI